MQFVKNQFLKLLKNQLVAGSLVLFIGTTFANFGNYLYHLLMGRMLGPVDYGALVSLISLAYLIGIVSSTLDIVVARFTSIYKVKADYPRIYSLFKEFSQKFLFVGIGIFAIFALSNQFIGEFLKITHNQAIILIGSIFIIRFLVPVNNGLLRGFLNFTFLSVNGVLGVILKLGLGVVLVKMGFSVLGAIIGVVIADYLTYLFSFVPLRFLFNYRAKARAINWKEKILYAWPTFIVVLSLTSLFTTDVLLVKHFFTAHQAGLYSALSMLGKIIFFASGAIAIAMFPLVAEKHENGKKYQGLLNQALLLVGVISVGLTAVYFVAPKLMVQLLYGSSYLEIAPLLGIFGIFIALYSEVNVLINFSLSIHQTKVAFFPAIAAGAQALLIWFFHNSILQVVQISILVTALLLLALLLYNFGTISPKQIYCKIIQALPAGRRKAQSII